MMDPPRCQTYNEVTPKKYYYFYKNAKNQMKQLENVIYTACPSGFILVIISTSSVWGDNLVWKDTFGSVGYSSNTSNT